MCVCVCGSVDSSPSLRSPPSLALLGPSPFAHLRFHARACLSAVVSACVRGGGGGGGRGEEEEEGGGVLVAYIYIYGLFAYTFIKSLRITQLLTEKKEKNELTMKRCARVLEAAAACITADRGDGGKAGGGGGGDGTVTAMWLRIIQGHTCAERGQANRL